MNNIQVTALQLDPYIPYEVDVAAVTQIGKGEIVTKIFFTEQSGMLCLA